jgi:hypothetical protein
MNPILRNILAVMAGVVLCMSLNSLLLGILMRSIGTPDGFIPNAPDTYVLLGPEHYAAPFLAHSIPSLLGAVLASLLAARSHRAMALAVGFVHLLGGIAAAFMIPAPSWFIAVDLLLAYIPMALLGWTISKWLIKAPWNGSR